MWRNDTTSVLQHLIFAARFLTILSIIRATGSQQHRLYHHLTQPSVTDNNEPGSYGLGTTVVAIPERKGRTPTQRTWAHSLKEQLFPPVPARPRARSLQEHSAVRHLQRRTRGAAEQASPPGALPRTTPATRPWQGTGRAAPDLRPRYRKRVRWQATAQPESEEKTERAAAPGLTFRPKTWTLCRGPLAGMTPPEREREAALALPGERARTGRRRPEPPGHSPSPQRRHREKAERGFPASPQGRPGRKAKRCLPVVRQSARPLLYLRPCFAAGSSWACWAARLPLSDAAQPGGPCGWQGGLGPGWAGGGWDCTSLPGCLWRGCVCHLPAGRGARPSGPAGGPRGLTGAGGGLNGEALRRDLGTAV